MIRILAAPREAVRRAAALSRSAGSRLRRGFGHRWVRRVAIVLAVLLLVLGGAFGALSWRLSRGPISIDAFTPLLATAIQANFGGQQHVAVGGTTIERDKNGYMSLRLVDVVLRDSDDVIVASVAKVEVAISASSLLSGQIHASRLRLVGAEVSVRIDANGKIAVFAGGNARPIAVADAKVPPPPSAAPGSAAPGASSATTQPAPSLFQNGIEGFSALLAWIDGLGQSGLDGYELSELGLVDGTLTVDDRREGRRWTFDNIDISLNRPKRGGVEFLVRSDTPGQPWTIKATAEPTRADRRGIQFEALRVPAKDLLLALRFADLPFVADLPISARVRGEIGPTGIPEVLQGAIVAEAGFVGNQSGDRPPIAVEHAAINFEWNAARRALLIPMQIAAGGNRYTLLAQLDIPLDPNAPWKVQLGGGSAVLTTVPRAPRPVVLDRIQAHGLIDFAHHRFTLLQGELGNNETGVALSGGLDYSDRPRLILGLAARPMSLATLNALWPSYVSPNVRAWVFDHISAGTVERVDIAINAPFDTFQPGGPPVPIGGMSIAIVSTGTTLQPVLSLPAIAGADVDVLVNARTATVKVARGMILTPNGRKLSIADGEFKVPNLLQKPSPSQTHFRVDGPVAAAAELLTMGPLREASGAPLDPVTSRGTMSGLVTVGMLLSKQMGDTKANYSVNADFTNFAADHLIMSQRLDAAALHLQADNDGYQIKGDVKIGGSPATMDYRKRTGDAEAELRLQSVLDDAMRAHLGFNLGPGLSGPVPIRLTGHLGSNGRDGRFNVEADLTHASIDDLLPGWVKPAAKPARATFTMSTKATGTRVDDLSIDSSGTVVRGSLEIDPSGNLVSANFPVFSPSSGDKVALKADRGSDGAMRVNVRGDVYDGRQFVKSAMSGPTAETTSGKKSNDLDLDVKLGAVAGFHGEALRSTELKLSRRGGQIRKFSLTAKIGRNASLIGELTPRPSGRAGVVFQTDDAGALFRFTNTYARMAGGRMSVTMDAPTTDLTPQNGTLVIDNFAVRGEAALNRVVAGIASTPQSNVDFTALHVDFARLPGRLDIHDGVVRGPVVGATIDGTIDYRRDDVRMRGTFVPLYGLNNMFGRLPIVGMLLGGSNEGLVGITYEVVGPTSAPVLRVNPMSAVAPGFIRKFFEFPSDNGQYRNPQGGVSGPAR